MNRSSSHWIAVAAALVLLATGLTALRGQAAGSPRQVVVAVVDIQKVITDMAERSSIEAELVRRKDQLDRQDAEKQQEIRDLTQDLGVLGPDSNAFKETEAKAKERMIALEVWRRIERESLEREAIIQRERLYRIATDAVARLAKKNAYDLVLTRDEIDSSRIRAREQLELAMATRKVIYAASELDITDQVAQLLNNEFKNRR
jgi:Skp family chaperone for outer membrane proteins